MTPSLSETLAPPSTTAYGRSGFCGEPLEHVDLGGHEPAGGVRQQAGDVVDRRLLAVHDAEAVGDEDVGERGELPGELGPLLVGLGRLARVEPEVLEQRRRRRRAGGRDGGLGRLPHRVGGEGDVRPSSSPSRSATGASEYLSSGAPLGRPRWAHTTTVAPASARASIVGTDARMRPSSVIVCAVQRHVEVGPDEDALAAQVASPPGGRRESRSRPQRALPTSTTRSTRRLE